MTLASASVSGKENRRTFSAVFSLKGCIILLNLSESIEHYNQPTAGAV